MRWLILMLLGCTSTGAELRTAQARPGPLLFPKPPSSAQLSSRVPYLQYWLPLRRTGFVWLSMESGQSRLDMLQDTAVTVIMKQQCGSDPFFVVQEGLIGDRCVYFWVFECATWKEWREMQEMLKNMDKLIKEGEELDRREKAKKEKP